MFNLPDELRVSLLIGTPVTIIGVMDQLKPGPPMLKVDSVQSLSVNEEEMRKPFTEVFMGYCTINSLNS